MTPSSLTLDQAMKLTTEAFLPCGCVTSANAEEDSYGFTVMSGDGAEVMRVVAVPNSQYSNPQQLGEMLEQARLDVEDKGCRLEPWTMPVIADGSGIPETPPNY
ncbi:hypothetical protein [Stutzerimonas nitrititolerans]|uniref:hypothetical protein n=1 Tax=Stutzerimonas nitrititolerans TaxID=2482751 RepID=UPI0028AD5C35|nr:hypothetical protein [Stutzerimonas nitrititolerans]